MKFSKLAPVVVKTAIVPDKGPKPLIFFLHGSGDDAIGFSDTIEYYIQHPFPGFKVIYPTASSIPYNLAGGEKCNIWFNRKSYDYDDLEDQTSMDSSAAALNELINDEISKGVPLSRIVIGGFSMGGGMALNLALKHFPDCAGAFAINSFISGKSPLYDTVIGQKIPPLFFCNSINDDVIPFKHGEKTYTKLKDIGAEKIEFHQSETKDHMLTKSAIDLVTNWINNLGLIDCSSPLSNP